MSLDILEFPGEDVLPIGYNITIICTSNSSKDGSDWDAYPYTMQYYYNENDNYYIKHCRGSGYTLVCKFFIQNARKSHSGKYECVSENRMECTQGELTLKFKGKPCHYPYSVIFCCYTAVLIMR